MHKRATQSISLMTSFNTSHWGKVLTWAVAVLVTVATIIFIGLVGPVAEPTFWQPVQLMDLGAEFIVFFFISIVGSVPVGYSLHLFFGTIEAAVFLTQQQKVYQPITTWLLSTTFHWQKLVWCLQQAMIFWSIRTHQAMLSIHQFLTQRQPQQRSKSKTPFLLFDQAPLLLAP